MMIFWGNYMYLKNVVCWDITDVSEECSAPIIGVTRIDEVRSSETSVLKRGIRRHIPEDILNSHRRENLKCYITLTGWTL
jgi:hypothetical protein